MNEQKFQLELERFRQKADWEKSMFYAILAGLGAILLVYLNGSTVLNLNFSVWLLMLAGFLAIGEFLISNYLDRQKKEILERI